MIYEVNAMNNYTRAIAYRVNNGFCKENFFLY